MQNKISTAKFTTFSQKKKPQGPQDFEGMKFPLLVKVPDSYGCIGLSRDSLVRDFNETQIQVEKMLKIFKEVLVEEFILGTEYTVLILGNSENLEIYPPAQRIFNETLALEDRWLTFKLVWEENAANYSYGSVKNENIAKSVSDIAKAAYLSMNGNGFGRVDIRKRDSTDELFVLEVNATCGIGLDSSSTEILKLCNHDEVYMIDRLLTVGKADPIH